ncbi:MAG: RNA 2',3'-cyclic phosphodiesterase [Candidatus Moraniibacteriota bacterium]
MLTRRLFLGIPLTAPLVKRLRREQGAWVKYPLIMIPGTNLHVTVLFLGFLPEERLLEIEELIQEAVEGIPAFELTFSRIILAPEGKRPNMVWLSGEASPELKLLRERLEQALDYRVPEHKNFHPHINLARIRRKRWEALPEIPPVEKELSLVEPVEQITLYESFSENGKRRYEPLIEFPLNG